MFFFIPSVYYTGKMISVLPKKKKKKKKFLKFCVLHMRKLTKVLEFKFAKALENHIFFFVNR
jgi:hypothetical protein